MEKKANSNFTNSMTSIPYFGDINNRRFLTAVLAGVIGGSGISAAANLLRNFHESRRPKKNDTDDETIVLTIPNKSAESGYDSMVNARSGETKITTNGGRQYRDAGRFGEGIGAKKEEKGAVKCSGDTVGNPGPNTVGTIVANTLGLTAGGLMSYEVVSRLFDRLNERRLKRKLEAAQQAYIDAATGASKRAEAVLSVLAPSERAFGATIPDDDMQKIAGLLDYLPTAASNSIRYPVAAYLLALMAGTGATAYVTKKVMDREFPEEKLKKDINRPTRILFRVADGKPSLVESDGTTEKAASDETCATLTAMLPVYMDLVEGAPNRTLAPEYVKLAEAAGTDSAGLLKMAATNMWGVYSTILKDPRALWEILKGTRFGLDFSKQNVVNILKRTRPATYRNAVNSFIDSQFANKAGDGVFRKGWNAVAKNAVKGFSNLGGRDIVVNTALKSAAADDLLRANYIASSIFRGAPDVQDVQDDATLSQKDIVKRVRSVLKSKRGVKVEANDARAAAYIKNNKELIKRLLTRLNAQGAL